MDKDRIRGSIKQIVGGVKQGAGVVLGDQKTEADGKAERVAGKIQNDIGSIKDSIRQNVLPR
jgi:uncharacterized protein YjbJ (UPF0337 family)